MTTALLFSAADEIRAFKSKTEMIEVVANAVSGELRARVAELKKLDRDAIRDALRGKLIDDLKAKLPDNLQFLLRPVSELDDQLIDLGTWSKEDGTSQAAPVRVTASLTGSVEIDGVLDKDLAEVLEGPVPDGSALFTVSVTGKIGIDARGTAATPLVSLAVAASGSRSQTLTVGFVRDAKQPVLLEMLGVRDYFVHPADLASVMASFADRSARLIQHRYRGTHSLGLKIALEHNLADALRDLIKDPGVTPAGDAEVSFSVSFKNSDDYVLTIERDSAASAFVHLKRIGTQERTRVFKLGASIEIKGLKDQIVNRIGELLPESPKVKAALAKLDELVDNVDGDGLRELVKAELVQQFDNHATLFETLLGNTPTGKVKDRILNELTGTLVDRANERVNLLSDEASAAANSISQDVAATLGLDSGTALQLQDFLASSLGSAIAALQKGLDTKIKTLNAEASEQLLEILEPFADVTNTIHEAIGNLGRTTAAALKKVKAGIEQVYSKYTNFRQKLIELVNERVTEQAAFSFVNESTTKKTDSTLISFRIIDANGDGVADLYAAIWARELDDVWDLLQKAKADAAIVDIAGAYVSVLENQRRAVMSLNLFGVTIGTEVMFSDEVAVGVDHTGKLVVAETQAELSIKRRRLKESQAFAAEWSFDFLDREPTLVPPIKIAVEVADKKLRKTDLRDFFDSLNKLECVKADAFDTVATALLGGVNSDKRLEDAKLGLIVALTWNDLSAILGVNRDGSPRADKWIALDVAGELFEAIKRGHPNERHFNDLERAATFESREALGLLLELGQMPTSKIKLDRPKLLKYSAIGRSMHLLDQHLEALQSEWLQLLAELDPPSGPPPAARVQQMIADVDMELSKVLAALFLSNTFALFPDASDVWQVAAGARVLLDRAKRDHLLLTMEGPMIARRIVA